jgi:hypothetical protein
MHAQRFTGQRHGTRQFLTLHQGFVQPRHEAHCGLDVH